MLDQLNILTGKMNLDSYLMSYMKNQFRLNCKPKWKNKLTLKKNTRRVSSAYLGINDYVFKIKIIKEQKLIMKEVLIKLISLKFNI